jgi:CRISPR-associated Csx2 family protein
MGKVYLSFLGTNNYLPCTYHYGNREVAGIRFVQEATVNLFCHGWGPTDRILIFLTEEARKRNWLDGGQKDVAAQTSCAGLETCLSRMALAARIEAVPIPDGKSEQEIWEIFQIVFGRLSDGDQVVFDITHAFRSIPMLAMVVLNYAKVMRNISLAGIYYGAFEVMGSMSEVRQIPQENRRAPIFNLNQFDALLDWTVAIDRFLGAGDAGPASDLVRQHIAPVKRESRGQDATAMQIGYLANRLKAFSQALSTCRGGKIPQVIRQLQEDIDHCLKLPLLPPLQPLLERLKAKVGIFDGNPVQDGLKAARWCLEHNLIQQGFTILQEFVVSYIIEATKANVHNKNCRSVASQAVKLFLQKIPEDNWYGDAAEHKPLARQIIQFFDQRRELAKTLERIKGYRDDINHGGFLKGAKEARVFTSGLHDLIGQIEAMLG